MLSQTERKWANRLSPVEDAIVSYIMFDAKYVCVGWVVASEKEAQQGEPESKSVKLDTWILIAL